MDPYDITYSTDERSVQVGAKFAELPNEDPMAALPVMRTLAQEYAEAHGLADVGQNDPATKVSFGVEGWTIEASYALTAESGGH